MRREILITSETHPDLPPAALRDPRRVQVWQIFIDGTHFLGIPTSEPLAHEKAADQAAKILATGRYEFVDVILQEERRAAPRGIQLTKVLPLTCLGSEA